MRNQSKRILALFIMLVFSLSTPAFSWPFGDKKKAESSPIINKSIASTNRELSDKSDSKGEEDFFEESVPELPKVESVSVPVFPSLPKIPSASVKSAENLPDLPPSAKTRTLSETAGVRDAEIARVQNQIHDIMKINESLKTKFSAQAAQIQKISEQAKIHEKILGDLEKSRTLSKQPNTENFLNQEKVRLIQKETEANKKYLESLKVQKENALPVNSNTSSASADTVKKS